MNQGFVYETEPIEITMERILKYAQLSNDFNPVHVDEAFAKNTLFGDVIAHGMLSLNVIWVALTELFKEKDRSRIQLKVRFLKPVKRGENIRARCKVIEVNEAECTVQVACVNLAGDEFIAGEAKYFYPGEVKAP